MKTRCFALGWFASIAALLGALELALWLRERHYKTDQDRQWSEWLEITGPRSIP